MTQARKTQIDPDTTPYYHCINRCVRRAYLCGEDEITGKSFDHRKQWIVDKLKQLADIFAIDICAYAVMSNHYHLVLHINAAEAEDWTEREVAERWKQLFNGNALVDRWLQDEGLTGAEVTALNESLALWRQRLMDISWFMRCLNEHIARLSNKEDNCKGRFWENRFKSQALLDEAALLSCMMYVDLNPIRADITNNPMDSDFTSIQQRLWAFAERRPGRPRKPINAQAAERPTLLAFADEVKANKSSDQDTTTAHAIPYTFNDYCDLIQWTGQAIREDKRGYIPPHVQPLLQQLAIKPEHWLDTVSHFESHFPLMAGKLERLQTAVQRLSEKTLTARYWCQGVKQARRCYSA